MDQKTREEFVKMSKADQRWTLEVFRLLGILDEEQQQAAVGLAGLLANYNTAKAEVRA